MLCDWRLCVLVSLFLCVRVCALLTLTCLVLPELVTSGTSDSESCSCKSRRLSLCLSSSFPLAPRSLLVLCIFFSNLSHVMLLLVYVCVRVCLHMHKGILCVVVAVFKCACVHTCVHITLICLASFARAAEDVQFKSRTREGCVYQ